LKSGGADKTEVGDSSPCSPLCAMPCYCSLWTRLTLPIFHVQTPMTRTQQVMGALVNASSNLIILVHCDMVFDCKGHKGWMRIADLRGDDSPDGWVILQIIFIAQVDI